MAHDLIVVGGGPGGYAVAFRAAAHGLDVALVEADAVGGTCLHRGCVPSKALLHVAGVLEEVHRADVLGLRLSYEGIDAEHLGAFRDGVVTKLYKGLQGLAQERTTLHSGVGRLRRDGTGATWVEVTDADGRTTPLEAAHVVVATGSRPRGLDGIDVDGEVVQTSDEALFGPPPARAVIIGAGAVGMEFASMWRPMGAEVTVVEALERILPLEDPDASSALQRAVRRRGIDVLTSARVRGVELQGDAARVEVTVDGEARSVETDRVLVAVGRAPATEGVGLAELGLLDERGLVVVDEWGATALPGIWAVGDLTPGPALAHAAFAEGFAAADRIAGVAGARPVDHAATPRVTYSHPEVASVGLTEPEARERYGDDGVTVTGGGFHGNAKGVMAGVEGLVKLVRRVGPAPAGAPGEHGALLGVHLVGPHATELIGEATLATSWEAVPAELAAITHAHPTEYEALGEAFLAAAGLPFHGR